MDAGQAAAIRRSGSWRDSPPRELRFVDSFKSVGDAAEEGAGAPRVAKNKSASLPRRSSLRSPRYSDSERAERSLQVSPRSRLGKEDSQDTARTDVLSQAVALHAIDSHNKQLHWDKDDISSAASQHQSAQQQMCELQAINLKLTSDVAEAKAANDMLHKQLQKVQAAMVQSRDDMENAQRLAVAAEQRASTAEEHLLACQASLQQLAAEVTALKSQSQLIEGMTGATQIIAATAASNQVQTSSAAPTSRCSSSDHSTDEGQAVQSLPHSLAAHQPPEHACTLVSRTCRPGQKIIPSTFRCPAAAVQPDVQGSHLRYAGISTVYRNQNGLADPPTGVQYKPSPESHHCHTAPGCMPVIHPAACSAVKSGAQADSYGMFSGVDCSYGTRHEVSTLSSTAVLECQRRQQQQREAHPSSQQLESGPTSAATRLKHGLGEYRAAIADIGSTQPARTPAAKGRDLAELQESPLACVALLATWDHDKQVSSQPPYSSSQSSRCTASTARQDAPTVTSMDNNRYNWLLQRLEACSLPK